MIREVNLYSSISKIKDVHPLEKISIAILSLIFCSYTKSIMFISINILLFIILNYLVKNPIKIVKKFLIVCTIFTLTSSLMIFLNGTECREIVIIVLRSINGALTISFFALTTPINQLVAFISKSNSLRDIADIIKSTERFIILIEDDYNLIMNAIKVRGGFGSFKRSIFDLGIGISSLFKNTFFRFKESKISLKNRCYKGRYYYNSEFKYSRRNIILIIIYIICTILFIKG